MPVKKPAYGEPCNRCGECCKRYPCPVGVLLFDVIDGPCPALEQDGDQFNCGLVAHPGRYEPGQTAIVGEVGMRQSALVLIGHGSGCDAQFVGEPINQAYRDARIEEFKAENEPLRPPSPNFLRALQVWGIVRSLRRETS